MIIRKAKVKDVPEIANAAIDLLEHHYKLDPYFEPAKNAQTVYSKFLRACVFSNNRHLIVAEDKGKIIGYALGELASRPPVFKIRKYGLITDVYVNEKYRKMGIARQFLEELYAWFEKKKLKYVELTVHPKNEGAKKAWSKYGFKEYMSKQRKELDN